MLDIMAMLGVSFIVIEGLMLLFWIIYLVQKQINALDIAWGLSFMMSGLIYYILGDGYSWRKLLVFIIVSVWSLRLVNYYIKRFQSGQEDRRYLAMLDNWNVGIFAKIDNIQLKILCLFILQGILVTVLSLPFALMVQNQTPYFSACEVFGLLIWMGGLIGETVADTQLHAFKQDPANASRVLEEGLWKYSRHPNYFFEWLIWMGYCIMALFSPMGWLGIISPILILYLLLKVSGIPYAEEEALRTKGDAYRDYQQRTSAFFPWFSKK